MITAQKEKKSVQKGRNKIQGNLFRGKQWDRIQDVMFYATCRILIVPQLLIALSIMWKRQLRLGIILLQRTGCDVLSQSSPQNNHPSKEGLPHPLSKYISPYVIISRLITTSDSTQHHHKHFPTHFNKSSVVVHMYIYPASLNNSLVFYKGREGHMIFGKTWCEMKVLHKAISKNPHFGCLFVKYTTTWLIKPVCYQHTNSVL